MSERERTRQEGEERERLDPDIDADGRRTDDPYANDGPRRVGAERESREAAGTRHTVVGTTTGERTTTGAPAGPA
jgi:hypothetical protein